VSSFLANSRCAAKASNPQRSRHQKFTSASILFLVLMEPHELWKPSVYSVHIQAPPPLRSAIRSLPTRASWCNVRSTELGLPGGGNRIQDRVSNKFCPNRTENTPKKVPNTQTKSNARRNSHNRSPLRKRQRTRRREVATLSSKAYKKKIYPERTILSQKVISHTHTHTHTHTFSFSLSLSLSLSRSRYLQVAGKVPRAAKRPSQTSRNALKISIDDKERGLTAKNNCEICILDDTKSLATALQQT
jgi:hypothetical protein